MLDLVYQRMLENIDTKKQNCIHIVQRHGKFRLSNNFSQ